MKLMRITTFKAVASPLLLGAFLGACATGGELTAEEIQYLETGRMPDDEGAGGDTGTPSGVGSSTSAPASTGSTTPPELIATGNGSAPSTGGSSSTPSGGASNSTPSGAGSAPVAGGANLEVETGGAGSGPGVGGGGRPSSGQGGMGGASAGAGGGSQSSGGQSSGGQGPGGQSAGGESSGGQSPGGQPSGGAPSTGHCMEGWEGKPGDTCSTQTQMDLAKCADFIQCYIDNDCGPSTCGANDDECGVNSGLGSSSPKMIADQTVNSICPSL